LATAITTYIATDIEGAPRIKALAALGNPVLSHGAG
jgi:hypothetical protein